ncbi:conserved hypothetical protein [Symbiobacterium thermophilum IAM 14863]|uniref:Carboxypeptidase regulatory-like domain-containing protein n=1 Tax=Symbiobacterium thermophilum (strain DSM 24528 / JCM 14929 / IAM 14863 / T) TaxID=292459 RepID=Q67QT0_SYMTH|nr:conserved hypothetical protein [Symbiobacterium thermophilum IAM 14863]
MNKEAERVNRYGRNPAGTVRRKAVAWLTSLLLLVSVVLPAAAQEAANQVLLRVADATGRPVPAATVEIYELGTGLVAVQFTGEDGLVRVPVTPGRTRLWQARATAAGYEVRETGWFDPAQGGVRAITLEPVGGELQLYVRDADGRTGASVTLLNSAGRVVAQGTAQAGRWVARDLAPGVYTALVSAEGKAPVQKSVSVGRGRVTVEAISLATGTITASGEVVDGATGSPLRGATVELVRGENVVVGSAQTGATGRFTIRASLPEDTYRLRVRMPGYTPVETDAQQVSPGGLLDHSGLNRIKIYRTTGTVESVLTTIGNRPIRTAEIVLLRKGLGEVASAKVDANGAVRFENVPAGEGILYQLVAYNAVDSLTVDHIDLAISDWFTVNPGGTVQIPLVAQQFNDQSLVRSTVTGTVVGPTGLPIEGATVELIRRSHVMYKATTDAEGKFLIENVDASQDGGFAQSPYMLRVSKEGYVPTREVVVSGTSTTTFHVPGGGRLLLQATLHPAMATVQGRIVDTLGRPVSGADVKMVLADGREAGRDRTDDGGWYRLGSIPTTTGWAALSVTAEGYLPTGYIDMTAALGAGDALPTVRLTPAETTVDGVVVDLQGRPVTGANVQLHLDGVKAAEGRSESDGYFSVKVDASSASIGLLVVEAEGYTRGGVVLTELPGPGRTLTQAVMVYEQNAVVEGRVLDQNGQAVSGARVELALEGSGQVRAAVTDASGRYRIEQPLPAGATWAWLRVKPESGTFAGSVTHGMDMAPIIRLTPGDTVATDLLVRR